jgi:NAD(P)-dependent dehydrogenase (short-subunit alcohol dehydrogenase family)
MTTQFTLAGKTALITGASGDLGGYFAEVLAEAGAAAILAGRNTAKLDAKVERLIEQGREAFALRLDVADPAQIAAAFASIESDLGREVDILVNNAGVMHMKRFVDETDEGLREMFETNVLGAATVARVAAQRMARRRSGCIVNVASTAGLRHAGTLSSYGASKAALIHLTRTMALELASRGVRVNALCPGNIESGMSAAQSAAGFDELIKSRIPMRRLGQLDDLAGPLLLLASDAGRYMTGAALVVDGGQTLSWQ